MKIHELPGDPGRRQKPKRVGRGEGSGHGKTSGYGHKGSKARSGRGKGYSGAFEGGQVPLLRRLPKRGFKNPFRVEYEAVNLSVLDKKFEAGAIVSYEALVAARVARTSKGIKILGNGELKKALTVHAHAFSETAKAKIEAAGGKCVIIPDAPASSDNV